MMNMLLIEDDKSFSALVQLYLDKFTIVVAGSIEEAREIYSKSTNFDVVALDLNLPNSKGLKTIDKIIGIIPLPIVVISGYDFPKKDVIERGAKVFVLKSDLSKGNMTSNRAMLESAIYEAVATGELIGGYRSIDMKLGRIEESSDRALQTIANKSLSAKSSQGGNPESRAS